jgi:hypothetical protein
VNSIERPQFEGHLAQMLAAYDRKPTPERTEAYWRGLAKMPLVAFERVVDHTLSERGSEELPSPKRCWQIYRDMRGTPTVHGATKSTDPQQSKAKRWGNQWLFAYLTSKGAATKSSLAKLIAAKDRIAESCESIPEEEFDPREMKPMLFPKFDELWQPITVEEHAESVRLAREGWSESRARV